MKTFDARTLSHDTLEYVRIQAVKAAQEGYRIREVARIFGVHRASVHRWLKLFRKGGMDALKEKPVPGKKPAIDNSQRNMLTLWLTAATPLSFGFKSILWTIEIIKELIEKKFSIHLSRSAVGRLLHRIDVTPQRPAHRSTKQNPDAVDRWLKEEFPKIKDQAKQEGATIYFLDEAGVCTDYHAGTTWSLKGLTPVVPTSGNRYRINMVAAISSEGELHFQVMPQSFNGKAFVEYLKRFSQEVSHPIWIVTDRYSVHRSKVVMEYLATTNGRIQIFFLPAYSPELNPVELIWNNIKPQKIARYLIQSAEELVERAKDLLESLKQMPDKVCAFFKKESVRYAI